MRTLITTITLACLLILSTVLGIKLWKTSNDLSNIKTTQNLRDSVVLKDAIEIQREVDKNGIEHVIYKEVHHYTTDDIKNMPVAGFIDTTAQALNIKNSQIRELTRIKSTLVAENLALQKKVNENNELIYYYKDKFLDLVYRPATDTSSNGSIDLKYNAELNYTRFSKGGGFSFKKKSNYIDIYSSDPRMTIQGSKSLIIKESAKKLGLQMQLSSQYDFANQGFGIGPGISVDLNRVNIRGTYLHNPSTNIGGWVLNGSYNILKF